MQSPVRTSSLPAHAMPLTERILPAIGGLRLVAVLAWAIVPLLRAVVFIVSRQLMGLPDLSRDRVLQLFWENILLGGIVLVSLWGSARLARELVAIEPTLAHLTQGDSAKQNALPFRGVGSVAGPLALTSALTLVFELGLVRDYGWGIALLQLLPQAAMDLPLMTVFWVYLVLLIGLDRLGQSRLTLDPFPQDRTLGLRPVGGLAFLGFWIITLGTVPVLLLVTRTVTDVIPVLAILLSGLAVFFLSLYLIHRQMVAAKRHYVEWVRSLYAEAFQRVHEERSLDALQAQAPVLSAVEALEQRAEAIYPWPFDASIPRLIVAIITSVIAAIVARLVLGGLGL
jgi:hypothetical protein